MTDRELLELAAKASGCQIRWNPLNDDGDALRLAVKLQLTIQVGSLDGTVVVTSNNDSRIYEAENYLPGGDHYAATRRAIVRAAAELAKQEGKT